MTDPKPDARRTRKKRPDLDKRTQITLRLPQWLLEWLDAQPQSRGLTIEAALIKAHDLRKPFVVVVPPEPWRIE